MNNIILGHESFVLLDGIHLTGVDSVSISSRNNNSIDSPLGTEMGLTTPSSPTDQSMTLSRKLMYKDPIYQILGKDKTLQGQIHDINDNSYYGFESGYIRSYSINCAVGQLPKVNTSLGILDEISTDINRQKNGQPRNRPRKKTHPDIDSPSQKNIYITSEDFKDNRIVGFDFSVSLDHKVYYGIGSTSPYAIEQKRPIKYSASVQLELGKTYNTQTFDFLDSRQNKDVSIDIEGRNGTKLNNIKIPNASLVGRNLSQSQKGSVVMSLSYVGHLGGDRIFLP
jgi:hypothetical protein